MDGISSLQVREFTQAIINFCNKSPIPAEIKRMALREVVENMDAAATNEIRAEILARDRAEKEKVAPVQPESDRVVESEEEEYGEKV